MRLHGILVGLKVLVSGRKFSRKIAQELLLLLLNLKQYVVLLFVVLLNDITKIKLFTILSLEQLEFVDVLQFFIIRTLLLPLHLFLIIEDLIKTPLVIIYDRYVYQDSLEDFNRLILGWASKFGEDEVSRQCRLFTIELAFCTLHSFFVILGVAASTLP